MRANRSSRLARCEVVDLDHAIGCTQIGKSARWIGRGSGGAHERVDPAQQLVQLRHLLAQPTGEFECPHQVEDAPAD